MSKRLLLLAISRALVFFFLLRICNATIPIPNFDLSSTTLDPAKTGFTLTGKTTSQSFGQSVKTAGDVNGDGYDDFILGAATDNTPGEAYVIYGGPNSFLQNINLASITLDPATTGFTITGTLQNHGVGSAVSAAGDINNDGYDDILVGTSYLIGEVYVIYGRETSKLGNIVIGSTVLDPATNGFTITQNAFQDGFGVSLSAAGDVDGDGFADIIIGAPRKTGFRGAVYVIYGRDKSQQQNVTLKTALDPNVNGFTITGNHGDDQFGFSVSTAGDIDGDGFADIIVGAPYKNNNPSSPSNINSTLGVAYFIYGGLRSSLQNIALSGTGVTLNVSSAGFYITGANFGHHLGYSVSTAGDFNHDGFNDIVIGAYGFDLAMQSQGAAYVIYGRQRSLLQSISLSSETLDPAMNGFIITGNAASDNLGISVSTAGDMNGDGYSDIIIAANQKNIYKGAAYVIYGTPKSSTQNIPLASVTLDPAVNGFMITGNAANDYYRMPLSTAGDVNGDGYDDIIIGAVSKKTVYVIHAACVSSSGSQCTNRNFCQACAEVVNPLSSRCKTCPSHCEQFKSLKACEICEQGYFVSTSTSLCEICPANCQQCTDSSTCDICQNNYYIYKSQCLAKCPGNTFPSGNTCQDCSANCQQCSDSKSCDICEANHYTYQSKCFDTCPGKTFPSASTCQDCQANCQQCSDSTSCDICEATHYIYQSQCLDACPETTFPSSSSSKTCQYCPAHCSSCTSQASCQTCKEGYILINSQCTTSTIPSISSPSILKIETSATQRIGSGVYGVGSAVCLGNPLFILTKLASKVVQNTRYLDLPITPALAEIYQSWNTNLISWDFPDDLSRLNHFKTAPVEFVQFNIGSPFAFNFWPTFVTIVIALCSWIAFSVLSLFFELKRTQTKISSFLKIIAAGSLNFALVQIYGCLNDIVLYFYIDLKTNPINSTFAWTSFGCGVLFLSLHILLILFSISKVKKYQKLKREGLGRTESFHKNNEKWKLFYADFNDDDAWCQSFLAFLIVRNSLSGIIIAVLYKYPLIQTIAFLVLDAIIILFLLIKKPFATLGGKLAQYSFEIITLLVHICTLFLAIQARQSEFSVSLNDTLCTCIIYLNTALVTGIIGFMFIEIYKTINQWLKSQKQNSVHPITQERSHPKAPPFKKFINAATNTEQNSELPLESIGNQTERFHLLPGFDQSQNISFSGVALQNSEIENSLVPDLDSSDRIITLKKPQAAPAIARRRLLALTEPEKNKSIFTAHAEEAEAQELEI